MASFRPSKETSPRKPGGEKSYSHEFVALLLATIFKSNGSAPTIDYKYMSALSAGTLDLTPSALEHNFRSIKKRAAEVNTEMAKKIESGEQLEQVSPSKKRASDNGEDPPTPSPKKTKASPKSKGKDKKVKDEDNDN